MWGRSGDTVLAAAPPHLQADIEATRIHGPIWVGSAPPLGEAVAAAGFRLLVLCANGFQPRSWELPGVDVLHAPMRDEVLREPRDEDLRIAWMASHAVVDYVRTHPGAEVLVTCMAGQNRSALVAALALSQLYGWDADETITVLRARRPGTLWNRGFVRFLERQAPARRVSGRR